MTKTKKWYVSDMSVTKQSKVLMQGFMVNQSLKYSSITEFKNSRWGMRLGRIFF